MFCSNTNTEISNASYSVFSYTYNPDTLCSKLSHECAVNVLLKQSNYSTYVSISNTTFSNLHNITVLSYYGESYRGSKSIRNIAALYNCKISNNTGNSLTKMLSYVIHGNGYSFGSEYEKDVC